MTTVWCVLLLVLFFASFPALCNLRHSVDVVTCDKATNSRCRKLLFEIESQADVLGCNVA
jgi:hypothetical protein